MDGRAVALAIPLFFLLIGFELVADRKRRRRGEEPLYRFADSISSLSCGVGQQVLQTLFLNALGAATYLFVWEHARLADLSQGSPLTWVAAFVLVDLCYWVYHWASHRVNFFWAMHVVHHSSEEYNLSTALRQSWLTNLTSWIFYLPAALLGVPPFVFVLCLTLNILYQFWIHTRLVGKLGPLELVFNTPSHHRVHHGIDPEYIDKNYGGVFIVWDRLFKTFVEERAEPSYGTVKPLSSFNPFWANLELFVHLAKMSRRTRRLSDKILVWLKPPEWQPEDLGGVVTVPSVDKATPCEARRGRARPRLAVHRGPVRGGHRDRLRAALAVRVAGRGGASRSGPRWCSVRSRCGAGCSRRSVGRFPPRLCGCSRWQARLRTSFRAAPCGSAWPARPWRRPLRSGCCP